MKMRTRRAGQNNFANVIYGSPGKKSPHCLHLIKHAIVSRSDCIFEREEAKDVEPILQDDHDHVLLHDVSGVVDHSAAEDECTTVNPYEYRSPILLQMILD